MKIDHIAIWAENLELLREFYIHYFDMSSSGKYILSLIHISEPTRP